jgi:fatty acid desaturase
LLCCNLILLLVRPPDIFDVLLYLPAVLLAVSTNIQMVIASFIFAAAVSFFRSDFNPMALLYVMPITIGLSLIFSALIHNASHESIPHRFLNRLVGEIMGIIQLSGFPDWKLVHVLHHQNSDDPILDPHPPLKKSYWEFAKGMRSSIVTVFGQFYFKCFGKNETSIQNLQSFARAAKFNMLMKIGFWFLILKPQLFAFAFLFSIVFKMLHFAWFNYITHRPDADGVKIQNLNNFTYKVLNFFSFGLYYHDNHHTAPYLFDPRNLPVSENVGKETSRSA